MRRLFLVTTLIAALACTVVLAIDASASTETSRRFDSASGLAGASSPARLASDVAAARLATEQYANNLRRATAAGYRIITRMIPNMGYHYLNPRVTGFNLRKPAALVYEHIGGKWRLGALEWVFTSRPARAPLPGARYGVFDAACHYVDGTFVVAREQAMCAATSPQTGAAFGFWHPRLITLHLWVWYPNPSGIYTGTNPLVAPFNGG